MSAETARDSFDNEDDSGEAMWSDVQFTQRVDEELDSMYAPKYKEDISKTSTEDLVKDLYRVIAGNGGSKKSMLSKLATTNAHLESVRRHIVVLEHRSKSKNNRLTRQMSDLATAVSNQVNKCEEIQTARKIRQEAVSEFKTKYDGDAKSIDVEAAAAKGIIAFVWKHKKVISIVFGLGLLSVFNGFTTAVMMQRNTATTTTNSLQIVEQHLNAQMVAQLKQLIAEEKKNGQPSNSRSTTP